MATKVKDCGCAENPNGLHMKTCPVWVNVGPDLPNRRYVRRDSAPERNTMTGCLTGHGVEQATAALLNDDSAAGRIIREQVKVYCAWLDDPTRTSDDGPDAAAELIRHAMLIHGVANTNRDFANILHKLVQAHRNGVRF